MRVPQKSTERGRLKKLYHGLKFYVIYATSTAPNWKIMHF